jgi:predicted DCC family thiol-disulfide oxidoreductase YuxK
LGDGLTVGRALWRAPVALVRMGARTAARPLRSLARVRPPAVADPTTLHPGDAPPTGGRLLLLYDGGCGICLHVRDGIAAADRRGQLAHDRIARHDDGLLADLDPEERYSSWHAVFPDGRRVSGSRALEAALDVLPFGRGPAAFIRRFPGLSDRAYRWFARNRGWISRGTGLIDHPERDEREQLHDPGHRQVIG